MILASRGAWDYHGTSGTPIQPLIKSEAANRTGVNAQSSWSVGERLGYLDFSFSDFNEGANPSYKES